MKSDGNFYFLAIIIGAIMLYVSDWGVFFLLEMMVIFKKMCPKLASYWQRLVQRIATTTVHDFAYCMIVLPQKSRTVNEAWGISYQFVIFEQKNLIVSSGDSNHVY